MSSLRCTPALVAALLFSLLALSSASAVQTVSRRNASCHKCASGKICVGPSGNKKCVKPMDIGQVCGKDPFWVCKRGLRCEHFVCRGKFVPEDGRCSFGGLRCRKGLKCAGTAQVKKCVQPMRQGKRCANDPYWVCADGLVCRGGVCQKNRIPKMESCRYPKAVCAHGLVCAGTKENPRCVMPMKVGGQCRNGRDPYWICEAGLECVNGKCQKPKAQVRASCRHNKSACAKGMVCAGPPANPRCVKPMGKGGLCGRDPYWVCKAGLKCVDRVCV